VAMAATVHCAERYISWATWSLWAVMTAGRPSWRPRGRAAASPALVRSRMRSRWNSARAAKTWKTSLPPGVVVSIASWRLRKPMPRSARPVTVSTSPESCRSGSGPRSVGPSPELPVSPVRCGPAAAPPTGHHRDDLPQVKGVSHLDRVMPGRLAGVINERQAERKREVCSRWPRARRSHI
jgi:hypothetical protein